MNGRSDDQLRVDLTDRTEFSFLLMGDTGEGDCSQYAVVPPLIQVADHCDAEFVFICGDVLYPVGDINEYGGKFYYPYRTLQRPIYSLPGNHDWYDSLSAYMYHFCTPKELPSRPRTPRLRSFTWRNALRRMTSGARLLVRLGLWRAPAQPIDLAGIELIAQARSAQAQQPPVLQPGPYYVIDTAYVRFVCIDTGILGNLDQKQGEWLLRVSEDPRPKILLTGKPLLVDGKIDPCEILEAKGKYRSVLEIVDDPAFRYAAVIGGDIHNYQHYPARVRSKNRPSDPARIVHHIVSGGGGAFMHATHLVPMLDSGPIHDKYGVSEKDYKAYPLRRDSLAAYSRVVQGMIMKFEDTFKIKTKINVRITDLEAAEFLHEKIDADRARPNAAGREPTPEEPMTWFDRRVAELILLIGGRRFHRFFSPLYDWDDPPFFKHFLRLDIREEGATIRCYAVTGQDYEGNPPVEDKVEFTWPT